MVAVISGNGLGLGNTSLTQLGQSQGGSPSLGQAGNRSYVNAATGNLILQSNDEGLLFDGLPLNVLRTYNSLGQLNGNDGWTYGFSRNVNGLTGTLNTAGSTITRTDDDGSSVVYTYNATLGVYQSTDQSGAIDTLSWNATSSNWTWTDAASTTQETYDATGQLTALTDTSSGASYNFSYSNGQLSQIVAGDGDTLIFGYNTNNQLISLSIQEIPPGQSTAVTRQAVSYGYDTQGRLAAVTTVLGSDTDNDAAGYSTSYTYVGNTDLIASVTQGDGTTVSYTYNANNQIASITTGTGSAAQTLTLGYNTDSTSVTDGLGNVTSYQYNAQGQLTSVIAPAVNGNSPTTTYAYDADGNLLTSTDPNGAITTYQYDASGNLLSVEDGAGNTVSYTYNANDQVTSKTTYTVPAQGEVGQSGYVAPSGAETTYYVYNATNQLAYTIDPLGAVSENDYTPVNGLSELTTTRQYLGATYSTSNNSPSNPPALADLQAWVQSSAVQSTLSQSTRIDYSYDVRGQLATQTQYDTVDANGNGVLTNGTVITTTTYDVQGKLLQTSTETGANRTTLQTTTYAYDGLGRVISKTDPLGNVTSYVYADNGSNDTLVITQANGLITTQVRNSAGLLVSSTQSTSGASGSGGSGSGSSEQANITVKDAQGRVVGQITYQDGPGFTQENMLILTSYDSHGEVSEGVLYTTPLTSQQIASLGSSPTLAQLQALATPSSDDQMYLVVKDDQGRTVAQVGSPFDYTYWIGRPTNYLTITTYNSSGEVGSTTNYATSLTSSQVLSLGNNPTATQLQALASSGSALTTYYVYDDQGRVVAQLTGQVDTVTNADGSTQQVVDYVATITSYGGAGGIHGTIRYATPLTQAQVASLGNDPTLAQVQALLTPSDNDQANLMVEDAQGNIIGEVGNFYGPDSIPENMLSLMSYDSQGQVSEGILYAVALTSQQIASLVNNPTQAQLQALATPSSKDQMYLVVKDDQGRTVAQVGSPFDYTYWIGRPTNYLTITTYNSSGEVGSTTNYATSLTSSQVLSLGNNPTATQLQALASSGSALTTYYVYDDQGRVVAQLTGQVDTVTNADGSTQQVVDYVATITSYGGAGGIHGTIRYATPLTQAQVASLGNDPTLAQVQALLTPSDNDQANLMVEDAQGNIIGEVGNFYGPDSIPENMLSLMSYDSQGQVSEGILYAVALTSQQIASLVNNPTQAQLQALATPSSKDQMYLVVKDDQGRTVAQVGSPFDYTYWIGRPTNYLTITTYNSSGEVSSTTNYATSLTSSQVLSLGSNPTAAQLAALAPSTSGLTTYYVYGNQGRVVAQAAGQVDTVINADGSTQQVVDYYLTTTSYGSDGSVSGTVRYGTPLTQAQVASLVSDPTLAQVQVVVNALGGGAGQGTSTSASGRTTQFIYNADGELVAQIDPLGNATFTFYDADGRVAGTVDPAGAVTSYAYDADGNVIRTTHYATTVSTAGWLSNDSLTASAPSSLPLPTASSADLTTTSIYDAAGNVVATFDQAGNVTTITYDGTGNVIATTEYATPLASANLTALGDAPTLAALMHDVTPSSSDRTTLAIYDADGRATAVVDPDGNVKVMSYDAAGDVIGSTVYPTPLTASQIQQLRSTQTMATLEPMISAQADVSATRAIYNVAGQQIATIDPNGDASYSFYNTVGLLAGTVDADGDVTTYAYDADGRLTQIIQYATPISTAGWLSASDTLTATYPGSLPMPASSSADRITTKIYDSVGHVVASIDPSGNVTATTYDVFGEAISNTQYAKPLTSAQVTGLGTAPTWAALQLVITTSANDRAATVEYNDGGFETESTDAAGYTTTYQYDADGRVVLQSREISSGNYAVTRNYYDGEGRQIAQIDADGYLTVFSYDGITETTTSVRYATALTSSQLAALTGTETTSDLVGLLGSNTANEQASETYNADNQVISSTAADGTVTTYQYDADGQLTGTIITPVSGQGAVRTSSTRYDSRGNVISVTDADGNTTSYVYDANGQRVESTDANGNSTWYYYDTAGRLLSTVQGQPEDGSPNSLGNVTSYIYDAFGELIQTTVYAAQLTLTTGASSGSTFNPDGTTAAQVATAVAALAAVSADVNDVTAATYTADGQVATVVDGDHYQTTGTYDAFGDKLSVTDGAGNTTTYTYDARGEKVSETDGGGSTVARTTSETYDALGRLTSRTDGNGNTVTYSYDDLGRQIGTSQVVQGATRTTQSAYDAFGNVLTQTDALGNVTTYSHDVATHTTVMTTPLGVRTTTVKDAFGNTVSVADAAGNATTYAYDAAGRLLTTTDALGNVAKNQYDADGNLILTTDADGNEVSYTYDANGWVLAKTVDPTGLNRVTSYTYDGEGRELSVTDALGSVTTYSYDADGNVLSMVQDAGAGNFVNQTTTYTYDGDGRMLTETKGAGSAYASTIQYIYDSLGRLSQSIVDPSGLNLVTSYSYDANGNLIATTDPNGNTSFTIYNEANEAVYSINAAGASGSGMAAVTQHWYDANGNLVSTRTYSNLVSAGSLTSLGTSTTAQALSAGAALANAAATSSDAVSYDVYNANEQPAFHIDALGNVTETRYNALGQVAETLAYALPITLSGALISALQAGAAQASDIQGALQQAGDSDATARASYNYYDADGRVVYTVDSNEVDGVLGAVVSETQYDAVGRVTADIVYGVPLAMTDVGEGATTASIAQAIAQSNTAATTRNMQYFYDAAGEKVAEIDPNGNISYIFYDANGRIAATVDSTGAVVQYTRDALGRVTNQTAFSTKVLTSGWLVGGKVTATLTQALPSQDAGYDRETVTSYDALGRVATVTHYSQTGTSTDGDTLTYVYDADSRVVQTADVDLSSYSATRVTNYFYDTDGNNVGILDANGYLTTYAYDALGQVTQSTAYATQVSARSGETLSQLIPASSPADETTVNYYDARGNLVGTLDADGYFTQYTYDLDDNRLTATRYATAPQLGASASFGSIVQALAGTASHQSVNTYDSFGDLVASQDYEGTVTTRAYDNLGNLVKETVAAGTSDARTVTTSYDAFGNVISTTDGLGNVVTYTYDLAGNETSMTDASGNATWYVYDADNRLVYTIRGVDDGTAVKNSLGEVFERDYDTFGDVTDTFTYSDRIAIGTGFSPTQSSVAALVNAISGAGVNTDEQVAYTYDLEGNIVGKTDANSNSFTYTYDGFNDRSSSLDNTFEGLMSLYTYDGLGHMTSEADGQGTISSSTGANEIIDPARTQAWTYDAFGNMASYTNGDYHTTRYSYDSLNHQLTQSLVVSGVVRETDTSYDAYGRVLSSTDAMGLVTTYSYDDAARSVTMTSPGGVSTTTGYNREGQKIAITDAIGNTTSYQYDADGNLLKTVNPDGSSSSNQYDAVGNLIETTDADGNVVQYAYDAAGRVLTKTVDPAGLKLVTTYTYDGRGLTISKIDPTGVVIDYQYDGNGNVSFMDQNAGKADIQTSYVYNELNELTSSSSEDHTSDTGDYEVNYYGYDAFGHLTYESVDAGKAQSVSYTYDADGHVSSKTDGNGNTTYYFYDEAGEQIYAVSPTGVGGSMPEVARAEFARGGYSEGAVVRTWYNADGQVVGTTAYATPLQPYVVNEMSYGDISAAYIATFISSSRDDRSFYSVYNADGQVQYTIDATGAVTQNIYNANGQVSQTLAYANLIDVTPTLASALQAGAASASDIQSALSSAGDSSANARITYTYYDDMGRVSFVVSVASLNGQSGGLVRQIQYDANGNIVAQIQYGDLIPLSEVGGGATTDSISQYLTGDTHVHVTRDVYDAAGRKVYSIDAGNNVTETQYDADGRVTWTLQYANPIAAPASWDVTGVATAVQATNANNAKTRGTENVYDAFGNVIETFSTASSSPTAIYTYNGRGLRTSYTDANGNTWTYTYDAHGNLTRQTSPVVGVASYSSSGEYQGVTSQSIETDYSHDGNGNLIAEIDASNTLDSRDTNYTYDVAGNLIETTYQDPGAFDPSTGTVVFERNPSTINIVYNSFGEAVVSQDANGNYAYNVYDNDGRLAYAVDGSGYVTGYQYDAYGNQTAVTRYATQIDTSYIMANTYWQAGQPLDLSQMAAGLVTSSTDRTITTTYDSQGNKLTVTEPAITYTNSDGTTATGSPVTQYTYDAYGNVTSQSVLVQGTPGQADAVWATTYNYYDELGHRTMTVDPMGYVTTNTYDAFGDVLASTQYATAINTSSLVAGGAQPDLPLAGDASTTGLDRVTLYTYDNNGNKTSVSVQRSYVNAQGQSVVAFDTTTYGYDADNRLITVTENGNTITTAYDALGRIISVTGPQVEVLVSNWQALLEANPSLALADPSLYTLASQVVSYAYDGLGNKLVQTVSSTGSSQSVSTYYQYDSAGHVVAEMTPLDANGVNWLSSQVKYMAYDWNGNLISESYSLTGDDNSTATVTTINTYDASNQQTSSVTWREGIPSPDKATSTTYDAFGEVIASGNGVTDNVVTVYDNAGNKLTSTDPKTGEVHTYGYNLAGQLVRDTVPSAANVSGTAQTLYTRDLDGRIVAEQAPSTSAATGENAGILHATYDAWGNVLRSIDANGNTTTYSYNERNDVVVETEAAVAVAGADGTNTTMKPSKISLYDIDGNLIESEDENGNVIKNFYNALGQRKESIDGAGNTLYTSYDALGNQVAQQDGNGNIIFSNVDALGRTVQSGVFELASDGNSRQAVWQQAYVLDQNGDRIISYDGIGSAYLQNGDATDAALHANYDGYDSQGKVIWSQDAAQRAASTANAHGLGNYGAGSWTQAPPNADFSQGSTGWDASPGWVFGNWTYDGQNWTAQFNPSNLSNGGSGTLVSTDRVPVAPGQVITASGNTEVQSTNGWGSMEIVWYDAQGNVISVSTDQNSPGAEQDGRRGAGTAWVKGTAPAGAAFAAIGVNAGNYNEGDPGVTFSRVWWDYTPPAYITSLGLDNGSPVITLPSGSFTDQVNNPDFAEGNVGWNTNGWEIHQASNANSGWEASFGGNGTATMVNQDRVPVVPGQTISGLMRLSLYLAPQGAAASGQVAINWYDANGNLIKTDTGTLVNDDHKGAWETSTITATAPAGAAYASLAVIGTANGIGSVSVESVQWNYQYVPQVPTGVVQDTYVYDMDGNLISQTTADGDTESWQYNQYGQVTQHTDLSGAQYTYTYDANTGAQIGESDNWSPAAQGQVAPSYVTAPLNTPNSETLTYYADGQIATESFSDGSSYSYQYDDNGNLIREEDTTVDGNNNTVHTVTVNQYDSHNRISSVTETNEVAGATMLQESFSYDAAGNRREVKATSNGTTQDAWYTYDGDNRVEIADGSLQNGQIVVTGSTGSYENAYDANGNVIKIFTRNANGDLMAQMQLYNAKNQLIESDYAVDVTQGAANNGVQKITTYDADGHALITQTYYEVGATIQSNNQTVTVSGELQSATVNFYDVVGRMAESQTFNTPSGWDGTASPIPTGTPNPDASTYGSLQLQSEVLYQGPNGTSGYAADGDVVAYQYRDNSGRVDQYQVNYLKKDSYLQADTTGDSNTTNVQPATAQTIYDTRGNEVALEQHTEDPYGNIADTVHVFAYNGDGEIIEREDGTATGGTTLNLGSNPDQEVQHYTYVNGQQLAHFDNAGTLDVLDQVTAFSSNNDSPNSYVVQTGDTLESIAQAEYGNANLWYVIAQANDLSSDTNLALGQRLQIPAVTTHSNSATTFKPYDPTSIVGNSTPSLPTIAPPPPAVQNGGCSAAEILVIIVTVVVTIVTYGATSELLYGEVTGLTVAQAATVGAIAGAAGSVAGQLTGMAEGIQSGFNWGAVAEGAIGGAIGAGATAGLANSSAGALTSSTSENGLSVLGDAVEGAATYVGNDVAAKLTDQPGHFSWAGLIATSLANAVSGEFGPTRSESQFGSVAGSYLEKVGARAVGDIVNREVSIALGDQHVPTWAQVGEDIAGYSIAEPIGEAIKAPTLQAIKAYQDQQAANATNAINAKVEENLAADNQHWSDVLWNQSSADVSTQLNNEGRAALDAALGQEQGYVDNIGTSDVPNTTAPSPTLSNSSTQSPYSDTVSPLPSTGREIPWWLVNSTTQTTTWGGDGSVTVTATVPHAYSAYDLDSYIGNLNQFIDTQNSKLAKAGSREMLSHFLYYDRNTSDEEATMAMGSVYRKALIQQKTLDMYYSNGSYPTTDDLQSYDSQVERSVQAWTPALGDRFGDEGYLADNPFKVDIDLSKLPSNVAASSPATQASSNAAPVPLGTTASTALASMASAQAAVNLSDIAASGPSLSLSPPSLAPLHIVPLDPDAIQITLDGDHAPSNLITVAPNTLRAQAGQGTSLVATTSSGTSAIGGIVQGVVGTIQSAHNIVTSWENHAADEMVRLGAWGDSRNSLLGDAAKVLGGVGYVLAAPVDWKAANAEFAGWKGGVQSGLASVGGWGDRRGGILGGAVYYGAGVLSVADEILQPGSVTDAALIVASPAISKVVGPAVALLNKIPILGTDLGQVGGKLGTAISTVAAGIKRTGVNLQPRYTTGTNGRLESAFAKIEPQHIGTGSSTNDATRLFARIFGNSTDDAGHAIGKNLGGSGTDVSNIFPQAPGVNRGAYRVFEQQIARAVQAGDEVYVRVVPQYSTPTATRPFQVLYQVRINGQTVTRAFSNF